MPDPQLVVLDSSVGVKWFRDEAGSDAARSLLARHRAGDQRIVVPAHFMHEVTATALRAYGVRAAEEAWEALSAARLTVVGLDDRVAREAFSQCRALGCGFYDALPAAVASLVGATLYSADRRAHSAFPAVRLIDV